MSTWTFFQEHFEALGPRPQTRLLDKRQRWASLGSTTGTGRICWFHQPPQWDGESSSLSWILNEFIVGLGLQRWSSHERNDAISVEPRNCFNGLQQKQHELVVLFTYTGVLHDNQTTTCPKSSRVRRTHIIPWTPAPCPMSLVQTNLILSRHWERNPSSLIPFKKTNPPSKSKAEQKLVKVRAEMLCHAMGSAIAWRFGLSLLSLLSQA